MTVFQFKPQGICCQLMQISVDNDTVENVELFGGCPGNHAGIQALVKGMKIDEVISRLQNIDCGGRGTSCPDQLAKALLAYKEQNTAKV